MSVLSRLITGGPGVQFRAIDPDHEGVHVIGSGGAPQTELADPDACRHGGLVPLTLHRGRQGSCPNCRCWFKVRGGRLVGHEPGPPTIDQCPYCGRPYAELKPGEKSYTDPPCRECAMAHDERDIEAAGFVPAPSEQY